MDSHRSLANLLAVEWRDFFDLFVGQLRQLDCRSDWTSVESPLDLLGTLAL